MIDIRRIRDQLNEETFEAGQRRALIGRISELFPEQEETVVQSQLQSIEEELHRHDLKLIRGKDDPDQLFAVQQLKYRKDDMSWLAEGLQWAARIMTVALEMVLPAVVGFWLDQRFGTSFLGIVGLLLGVPLALWHLVRMGKHASK